jgi:hypothetical protein
MTVTLPLPSPLVDEELLTCYTPRNATGCGHILRHGERYLRLVPAAPHPALTFCSSCTLRIEGGHLEVVTP